MLKLTIYNGANGSIIDLNKDTKIRIKVVNPLFSDAGLFSYLIKVFPESNERFFKYANSLDTVSTQNLTFKLEVGTDIFAEGEVKVTESGTDFIEFYLKSGNSSVSYFLQNTLMNKTNIWGNHNNLGTEADTLQGCFPTYKIITPPIALSDGTILNTYDFINIIDHKYPAVYVRHLFNKLIAGLGYVKKTDFLNTISDFNRLAFFSPVYKTTETPTAHIYKLLPAISIADFINDFRTRFNVALYLSPFLYDAEILSIDECLQLPPVDWTNKFISYRKIAPPSEKQLNFAQDNSNTDNTTAYKIIKDTYAYLTENTISDMKAYEASHPWDNLYYITSLDRFMQATSTSPSTPQLPGFHYRPATENFGGETYMTIVEAYLFDYSVTRVNAVTTAHQENIIAQFLFPQWDGEINYSWGWEIHAKSYAPIPFVNPDLIVKLVGIKDDGTERNLGYDSIKVNSTSYTFLTNKLRTSGSWEIGDITRIAVRFYAYGYGDGSTITIQFGGLEYGTGDTYESTSYLNPKITEFKELGIIADTEYGQSSDNNKPTDFKPKSKLPVNSIQTMMAKVWEMPESNIGTKDRDEQEDFEYIVYRGLKPDLQQGTKYAGYCNLDVLDLEKEDYTNKLQTPVTPNMSLAWRGEKGILAKLWSKRLIWERYYKRDIELSIDLTVNDITNHKIYQPFSIKGNQFIIFEMDFELDVYGNISNTIIKPFTL